MEKGKDAADEHCAILNRHLHPTSGDLARGKKRNSIFEYPSVSSVVNLELVGSFTNTGS